MPDKKYDSSKSGRGKPAAPAKAPAKAAPKAAAKPGPKKADPAAGGKSKATSAPAVSDIEGQANPLHKKLRLRSEDKGLVVAPPPDADNPLLPLPKDFVVVDQPSELPSDKGPFDYVHVFARDRVELAETLSDLSESLAPGGSLWISWMKPSSKLKGGGQPGDLNESTVRRIGLTRGFVDTNLASLDRDWGVLRLVRRT